MNIFQRVFHKHSFDPAKWAYKGTTEIYEHYAKPNDLPCKIRTTYANSCLTCGDMIFRQVEK